MLEKFLAYSMYKDSGLEWLGQVPGHWEITQIKYGHEVILGKMLQNDPKNPSDIKRPYLRAANITWNGVDTTDVREMWISEQECQSLRLHSGDVLISEGGDVGRSCVWGDELEECYFQNAINRARSNQKNFFRYLYYWMSFVKSSGYIDIICNKATIAHYTAEKVQGTPYLMPSFEEQNKIANFLVHETAKIDLLIAKQQQLIALLKEKRQTVISHAVTKGLDPNVKMKGSGVEWLGEVPEHWVVAGFKKYLSSIVDYRGKTPDKVDDGVFLVTARNIKEGVINYELSAEYVSENDYEEIMRRGTPEVGDVLFTTEAPLGEVACVDRVDIALAQRIIKFRGEDGLLSNDYLKYFIMSSQFQQSLMTFATGSTALGIKAERMVYLRQLLPPMCEQLEIVRNIEVEIKRMDGLVEKCNRAIDLMKERRSSVISAAVTGKIDLRDWQPTPASAA